MNPNPKKPPPIPDRSTKPPLQPRPPGKISDNQVQRHLHGSRATNTLNLPPPPPPCYVDHLLIREVWGDNKTERPEDKTKHRDPAIIAKDIEKNQKALENAYYQLDNLALSEKFDADAEREKLNKLVLAIQDKHIRLEMERIAAQASLAPYEPPKGVREFVIVERIPPKIQDVINLAENKLKPLRAKLSVALDDWYKTHTDHEAVKKELMEFARKKRKLAEARDKARAEYEVAVRTEKDKSQKSASSKRAEAFKKLFKQDVQSKLQTAQKDKGKARENFLAAQNAYREFAFHRYGQIKTREKELYKLLIARLKEVNAITNQIGEIENKVREAKNTLVTGSQIQMTSFEKGFLKSTQESQLKKVPTVELELDGKTNLFPETKNVCRDAIPKFNGPQKHPHLSVSEPESKLDGHAEGVFRTRFKIFENHRKLFKTTEGGLRFGIGVFSGLIAVFQHIFSAFPKKRYYKIIAQTCGFMPTGMKVPDKLEAELEVFPADVYTMSLKMQPVLGYENTIRDEKISDTTKIQGEAAYSDAENAASEWDHTVSSGTAFSVLGVTQSSSSSTVTKGIDGREIVTQTTMTRDGVFGTATITDVSTGKLDGSTYSGTMVRSETIGSPLTDSPGGKLVSLNQSYKDSDGTVRDESKSVDSDGVATWIQTDDQRNTTITKSGRPPSMPSTYLPQIPVDLTLICNGIEDPVTEDLRRTLGLVIFLVRKCGDMASRIGNVMPSFGWKFGFNMTFLTGAFSYTHDFREHLDKRVWLHHQFDIDLNIVTAKVFVFGGASYEFLVATIQAGLEVYIRGMIGVKGSFDKTHPDAEKKWDIGFGPNGSVGVGAELKAIVGQPDWLSASATIETAFGVESTYWARKEGEDAPFLEAAFKWEGVKLKAVAHLILIGHWEEEIPICDEREIWSGRFPKESKEDEIKKMLADQTEELEKSNRKRAKEALELEKKMAKKGIIPAKIKK